MNLFVKTGSACLLSLIMLSSCDEDSSSIADSPKGTGKANVYLTDAPVDDDDISSVVISVSKVDAKGPDGWVTIESFEEPVAIDLLEYQNGSTFFLGDEELAAGNYSEIRLLLNAGDSSATSNTSSYLQFADSTTTPLFVPSGSESGYKVKGDFTVSEGSEVDITLDFDVRKAVVKAGKSGKYLLKPTIRLIKNEESGTIEGAFESPDSVKMVVFAYNNNTFDDNETTEPAEGEVRFANAVSSAVVENNLFTLSFLNEGTYDLYFVTFDEEGNFIEVLGYYDDADVQSGKSTEVEVSTDILL